MHTWHPDYHSRWRCTARTGVEAALAAPLIGELTVGSALAIGGAGLSAMSLLSPKGGGQAQTAAPPAIAAPTVMPIPDDAAAVSARRRQIAAAQNRSGRASTVLSQGAGESDTLG